LISAAFAQFSYISPLPGSKMKNKETSLLLKTGTVFSAAALHPDLFEITGTKSGKHSAELKLSKDGKTLIVTPSPALAGGEVVSVKIAGGLKNENGDHITGTSFEFETHRDWTAAELESIKQSRKMNRIAEYGEEAYRSMFEKDQEANKLICNFLPPFTIDTVSGAYYDAEVFYRNQRIIDPLCHTSTIISSRGDSLFSFQDQDQGIDFKVNDNGYLTYYDINDSSFVMIDSSYNLVKKFYMKNGYAADEHEFRVYPDGSSLLFCYDVQIIDMTPYGGQENAEVMGLVIQQLDADDNVTFEWSGWDYFEFTESNQPLANAFIDYIHGNSMELDFDGNLLLSSRHLDEITKINLSTGEIMWRLGGKANEFTFENEIGMPKPFSYQHHFRKLPNGNYSMFDNGNNQSPERSTAKEYKLDQANKSASLEWYYDHPQVNGKEVMGLAMGSVEYLPNGNRFIDWGFRKFITIADIPNFTEVDSAGNIVWEFWFKDSSNVSYRAFKTPWDRCNLTSPLSTDGINLTLATLHWNTSSKVNTYLLEYRECGSSTWMSVEVTGNSYQLTGLEGFTCYEWRITSTCDIYNESFASEIQQFFTQYPLGVQAEETSGFRLEIFPNPTTGWSDLNFNQTTSGPAELIVFNMIGGVVMRENFKFIAGANSIKVDFGGLPAGTYTVELKTRQETAVKKVAVF
jgi:hypothetical protein